MLSHWKNGQSLWFCGHINGNMKLKLVRVKLCQETTQQDIMETKQKQCWSRNRVSAFLGIGIPDSVFPTFEARKFLFQVTVHIIYYQINWSFKLWWSNINFNQRLKCLKYLNIYRRYINSIWNRTLLLDITFLWREEKVHLFIEKAELQWEKERNRFHLLVSSSIAETARTGLGWNLDPGDSSGSPNRAPSMWASSTLLLDALAGS